MKEQDILLALEDVVASLNIQLRYEKGDFSGGFCRLDDDKLIILNADYTRKKKINILSRELSRIKLDDIFIVPAIRKLIEKERQNIEFQEAHDLEEVAND